MITIRRIKEAILQAPQIVIRAQEQVSLIIIPMPCIHLRFTDHLLLRTLGLIHILDHNQYLFLLGDQTLVILATVHPYHLSPV